MGGLLVWNVRGLNKPSKQRVIREICSLNKIEVCALLKVKLNKLSLDKFINKSFAGWCFHSNFDACDGGRNLVLWLRDLFDVKMIMALYQLVHCEISILGVFTLFLFTVVYGLKSVQQCVPLWE